MAIVISKSLRHRLAELPPKAISVPDDVIAQRKQQARIAEDWQTVRLLDAASAGLQFTEIVPRTAAAPLWEALKSVREGKPERTIPESKWCFNCLRGRCADDSQWQRALSQFADRTLPEAVRIQAAEHLACRARCTDAVVQQLQSGLSSSESDNLRHAVLVTARMLGSKAAALVPHAVQIVQSLLTDPRPESLRLRGVSGTADCPLYDAALQAVVGCQTADHTEAASFLCHRTDYHQFGVAAAIRTIQAMRFARAFHSRYLDRVVELAVDERAPDDIRKAAIGASGGLLRHAERHIPALCGLLASPLTPHELRTAACESLAPHAAIDNPIAATLATMIDDLTAPDDLRLRALCAFRGMPIEVQHLSLAPALRLARQQFPLAVADIAQDLIADVIRLALLASGDADQHEFLQAALPAPFELQLRSRMMEDDQSKARPFLLGRDVIAELVSHPWLLGELQRLLPRRMRSVANGTWEELLQQLHTYVLLVLSHPVRPAFPDPDDVVSFPRSLINRVDNYAKHHLPKDFGGRRPERPDVISIEGRDHTIDLEDSWRTPDVTAAETELLDALTQSLDNSIDSFERQSLVLCVVEGLTLTEAEQRFEGKSSHQVNRAKHAALRKLRFALNRFVG